VGPVLGSFALLAGQAAGRNPPEQAKRAANFRPGAGGHATDRLGFASPRSQQPRSTFGSA
jgi:hypothetical protein